MRYPKGRVKYLRGQVRVLEGEPINHNSVRSVGVDRVDPRRSSFVRPSQLR